MAVGAGLGHNIAHFLPGAPAAAVVLLGMSAYLAGVTGAPLTSAVIAMELTDNQDMVIPIMAACLLARAAASLFCPTPVYKDFAERMVQDFERQQAARGELPATGRRDAEILPLPGSTSAFDEPAAPQPILANHPTVMTSPRSQREAMSEPRWDRLLLNATLATFAGDAPYGLIEHGAIALHHGRIAWIGGMDALPAAPDALAGWSNRSTVRWSRRA